MSNFHRFLIAPLLLLTGILLMSSCGNTDNKPASVPSPNDTSTSTPTTGTTAAARHESVRFLGGQITPVGKLIQLRVGEPLEITITADEPGELHVHSTPEQTIEFASGSTSHDLVINRPGVVEVEEHHSGALVFKLQVR